MGPGASLSRDFFVGEVRPIVERVVGDHGFLAARLGSGSDVLGLDDAMSGDHDYGCRLTLLLDDDAGHLISELDEQLETELPERFAGHPVRFPTTWDPRRRHKIDIHTVHDFARSRLGFDLRDPLTPIQWLCLTGQSILEVVGGPVFHDTTTAYRRIAETLRWYPSDLWHYVLASAWTRLSQELPQVGRTGERGDRLGSQVIAARLSRDLMHLAFLLERTWPPYPKWAGTALVQLPGGPALAKDLERVNNAGSWQQRQDALGQAIERLAERQHHVGPPTPRPAIHPFFDRPYLTTNEDLVTALVDRIKDSEVSGLPRIGSVEQWCDNVDVLSTPNRRVRSAGLYQR